MRIPAFWELMRSGILSMGCPMGILFYAEHVHLIVVPERRRVAVSDKRGPSALHWSH